MGMGVNFTLLPRQWRHNHNYNHKCYSALPTSMKTDSALQCLQLQKQTSPLSSVESRSRTKVPDVSVCVGPNTHTTDRLVMGMFITWSTVQ